MNDIEELIRFYKTFRLLFCFHGEGGRHVEQTISSKQNLSKGNKISKRRTMNQRELEQITQWIKEATTKPNADENIRLIFKLASNSITDEKIKSLISPTHVPVESTQGKKSFITHFTKKEISKMSKTFKYR